MTLPSVSCLCPTFGRAYLLEEAIWSFLRQDYPGPKELIVCNDFSRQEFVFDHPEVKIVNLRERLPSLGDKRNFTAQQALGEYFLTWGDDDIHLPKRISRMVSHIQECPNGYSLEGWHFCYDAGKMRKNRFGTAGAHIVSRDLYWGVGGISPVDSGEDVSFNDKIVAETGCPVTMCLDEPQFIYRWGSDRPHISAVAQSHAPGDCYRIMEESAHRMVNTGVEPGGTVQLHPKWTNDWEVLAAKAS